MAWYYADNGRQVGPVEEPALDDLVRQGVVRDDTLVWREGMASWQPHGVVRPRPVAASPVAAAAPAYAAPMPPPPQAAETRYCAECGRPFPSYELSMVGSASVCSSCRPSVMQRMGSMAPAAAQPIGPSYGQPYGQAPAQAMAMGGVHYAGFWIRFVAFLIDAIILGIIGFIVTLPLNLLGFGGFGFATSRDPSAAVAALPMIMGLVGISMLIRIGLGLFYEVYFLTTRAATPGKIALGLKVIRADGGPITTGLAIGRFFGKILSAMIFWIGYIIAGFDPEKRALHDRICDTRVIYAK